MEGQLQAINNQHQQLAQDVTAATDLVQKALNDSYKVHILSINQCWTLRKKIFFNWSTTNFPLLLKKKFFFNYLSSDRKS